MASKPPKTKAATKKSTKTRKLRASSALASPPATQAKKTRSFWARLSTATFTNEASVETHLVLPLLDALGYYLDDIRPKFPISFFQGRTGRPHEADFAVFATTPHDKDSSLLVVETKPPSEALMAGQNQAESYAQWLRAPFYVLTNGLTIELWQMQLSRSSTLVFTSSIRDLPGHRGTIEGLLRKDAAIAHCKALHIKALTIGKVDLAQYVKSETSRDSTLPFANRRLHPDPAASPTSRAVDIEQILTTFAKGCIISGKSGAGKSTALRMLRHQRLSQLTSASSQSIPIDINLPEVYALNETLEEYAQKRIASHCPPLAAPSTFSHFLRNNGALLLCDGFDRLAPDVRSLATAEFRALQRDYPLVQLLVASRQAVAPHIGLPTLELRDLDPKERIEMARCFGDAGLRAFHRLPTFLQRLSRIPFFLNTSVQYVLRKGHPPADVADLFRSWIDELLNKDDPEFSTVTGRRRAMDKIAQLTAAGVVSSVDLDRAFRSDDLLVSVVDELVSCGILASSRGIVEYGHEVIADFVRAERLCRAEDFSLSDIALDDDSSLPVFLAALSTTVERQKKLWAAIREKGVRPYLSSVRHRADISGSALAGAQGYGEWFLSELRDGVLTLIDAFCDPFALFLLRGLSGDYDCNATRFGVTGTVAPDGTSVVYSFECVDAGQATVTHEAVPSGQRNYYQNIALSGERPDGARSIAANLLRSELMDCIEERRLPGGPVWAQERLLEILRDLDTMNDTTWTDMSLVDLEQVFASMNYPVMVIWPDKKIPVGDVLTYIETMRREHGDAHRMRDSIVSGPWGDFDDESLRERCVEKIRSVYLHAMLAYREVAESVFDSFIRRELHHYPLFPVSYDITATGDPRNPTLYPLRHPVADWRDASVTVRWSESAPNRNWEVLHAELVDQLASLGRRSSPVGLVYFTPLWLHSGPAGAAVELVCEWVKDDLEHLFEEVRD